ncbi:unnamed protein product [Toxocara canis]|uniref:Uncharacterized protein n=1 Tax=Toxocara canis TaxID=6265 RepID=A0A3P7EZX3_TOXCA|nr:unnamed protein product [Toxocara canis]
MDADLLEKDVGVKGLGPLQLLNYAFKKGAIKEALKESNEIEEAHTRMEREMEDAFGVADHNAIRRAILRQKARRPKADYDESTFNEESITHRGSFISADFLKIREQETNEMIEDNLDKMMISNGNFSPTFKSRI